MPALWSCKALKTYTPLGLPRTCTHHVSGSDKLRDTMQTLRCVNTLSTDVEIVFYTLKKSKLLNNVLRDHIHLTNQSSTVTP